MDPRVDISKAWLRSELASRRSALLLQLVGLPEHTLTTDHILEDATARDILLAAAHGDMRSAGMIERVLAGDDVENLGPVPSDEAAGEEDHGSIDAALTHFLRARATFLSALARVEEEDLGRSVSETETITGCARECADRDARAADSLAEWRAAARPAQAVGPKSVLIAALRAARKELLTTLALVPAEEREDYIVAGGEPLREILARTTRGEEAILLEITTGAGERPEDFAPRPAEAGEEDGTWASIWSWLHSTHQRLIRALEGADDSVLSLIPRDEARGAGTIYQSVAAIIVHDHHQAARLRRSFEMSSPRSRAAP